MTAFYPLRSGADYIDTDEPLAPGLNAIQCPLGQKKVSKIQITVLTLKTAYKRAIFRDEDLKFVSSALQLNAFPILIPGICLIRTILKVNMINECHLRFKL